MSTVLDVAVCLSFVAAAVVTLAAAPQSARAPAAPDADPTASGVSTVTAAVPAGNERVAHDTLAGHLGRATVIGARLDGDPLVATDYPAAVENETATLTADRTFVTARWEPYPDAPLAGEVAAGREPPSTADVATTTLTVDSGVTAPERPGSFRRLAERLAVAYVARLFPPERTYARLVDSRTAPETVARYRAVGDELGVAAEVPAADAEVRRANAELAAPLAARLESDLQERYGTPQAAAANATAGEVEVVVRRWEP